MAMTGESRIPRLSPNNLCAPVSRNPHPLVHIGGMNPVRLQSDRWPDILIHAEEVFWVVFALQFAKATVIRPVGSGHRIGPFIVTEVVHVPSLCLIALTSVVQLANSKNSVEGEIHSSRLSQ
jgi:hypothetical protein